MARPGADQIEPQRLDQALADRAGIYMGVSTAGMETTGVAYTEPGCGESKPRQTGGLLPNVGQGRLADLRGASNAPGKSAWGR